MKPEFSRVNPYGISEFSRIRRKPSTHINMLKFGFIEEIAGLESRYAYKYPYRPPYTHVRAQFTPGRPPYTPGRPPDNFFKK